MKSSQIVIVFTITCLTIILAFQNCEKKRTTSSTTLPSLTPTPTSVPNATCYNSPATSKDWTPLWGTFSANPAVPTPAAKCGTKGIVATFKEPVPNPQTQTRVIWSVGAISKPRSNVKRRLTSASFMVPSSSFTNFNHFSAFPSFSLSQGFRIGAAVFKNQLGIEFFETHCFDPVDAEYLNLVPLKSNGSAMELKGGQWYRLAVQITDMGAAGLKVDASVGDLLSNQILAATSFTTLCSMPWYRLDSTSWVVGGSAETTLGVEPNLQIHFTDLNATAD